MEYVITGGSLKMSKKFFAKESFKSGSYLRRIMGMDHPASVKVKQIIREGDQVMLKYTAADKVVLPDDFTTFFDEMKGAYGSELQGEIAVNMNMDFEFDDCSVNFKFV